VKGGELVGIGETLKEARKARGLSLEEVAEKTKIRPRYLEAIEVENFDLLPGQIYVRGFIRNYARFLGLNPEPLVALFDECYGKQQLPAAETIPEQKEKNQRLRRKPLVYLFLAAAACLIVFGIYAFKTGAILQQARNDAPVPGNVRDQSVPEQIIPPPNQPATPRESPVPRETSPQKGVNLVLNVVQDRCWMRVVVDGETKFTGELAANQSRSFFGKERIEIKLGNAGAVQVQVNGRNLGYLGGIGEVIKREFTVLNEG